MASPWPLVPLGTVLSRSEESIDLKPDEQYREVTVRLWGKGVVLRRQVTGAEIAAQKRAVVRAGQFILSRIDARNGALGVVPDYLDGAVVSTDFPAFTVNRSRALPEFLGWMARTRRFVDLCSAASEGTTNRVRLKEHRFLASKIPLPPLQEQRRIVARIEELAGKIEEARALRREAKAHVDALVAVARALAFETAAKGGAVRLDHAAILERGRFSYRPRNDPRFFGGKHPWIQIAEIEASNKYIRRWTQTLNEEGLAISRKFPQGTVLVSIAATIGAVGILGFDCCVPDSIVAATPRPGFHAEYIYHYLSYVRSHLQQMAPQSAQKNVNLRILSGLPIPALPPAEQRRIVAYLDDLQTEADALKHLQAETAAELSALLPSALARAFKGDF